MKQKDVKLQVEYQKKCNYHRYNLMDNKELPPRHNINIMDCYPSEMLDGTNRYKSSNNYSEQNNVNIQNETSKESNVTNQVNPTGDNFNLQGILENLVKNLTGAQSNNLLANFLSGNTQNGLLPMLSSLMGNGKTEIMSMFNGLNGKNSTNSVKNDVKKTKIADFERVENN